MKQLPIIDLALADNASTKPQFLRDLSDALFRIGFLYLINHGLEDQCVDMLGYASKLFEISDGEKQRIHMLNSPHFVGYTGFGAETTAKNIDNREQFDFGDALDCEYEESQPQWLRLRGPSQYPGDDVLEGFERITKGYFISMEKLAAKFLRLVAESLNLPEDSFDPFTGRMNRLKIIKYPAVDERTSKGGRTLHKEFQGVGPHKDSSGMFTFVLQDEVGGLEVLDSEGEWIIATPIRGSFVVNIAQGFEALTGGRCGATTHQVTSPEDSSITRYSIPYFYSVRLDLTRSLISEQLSFIEGKIPERVDLKKQEVDVPSEFILPQYSCFGEAHLRNRIVSHKDVGKKWYPELYELYHKDF